MPLIRVCARRRGGACGADAGGAGGLEPFAEGGGAVVVVPGGSGVSVMAVLLSRVGASR
jgi:hypothetical protein